MSLNMRPLDHALGAEVLGVDWRGDATPQQIAQVYEKLLSHHLLCLRSQALSAAEFFAVAKHFGEPQLQLLRDAREGDTPQVSIFDSTYVSSEKKPSDLSLDRRSGWHTDDSYFAAPAKITLLQALEIPDSGGETRFCNARQAYVDLSSEDKARFDPLAAVHSYDTPRAPARAQQRNAAEAADTADQIHPLIRTHDETGDKAIYFNSNRTDRIVDMDRAASDALLDRIHVHMTQDKYQYHHRWQVGDILMWDNRSVTHSVNMDFPVQQKRIHQRILLRGDVPR